MPKCEQACREKAQKHWEKLCHLVSQTRSPFKDMTEEEVIEAIRKVREKLWEEKIGSRS